MNIFKMIRGFFLKRSRSSKIMQSVIFHVIRSLTLRVRGVVMSWKAYNEGASKETMNPIPGKVGNFTEHERCRVSASKTPVRSFKTCTVIDKFINAIVSLSSRHKQHKHKTVLNR